MLLLHSYSSPLVPIREGIYPFVKVFSRFPFVKASHAAPSSYLRRRFVRFETAFSSVPTDQGL